ncbi:MAG TPA: penicillin-binding transpeptidase domain-containing protein [Candidatus Anoxymicrobiaceae bacterium]
MNRQIKILLIVFIVCLVAVGANLFYIQIIGAEKLQSNAYNKRHLVEEYAIQRGDILTKDSQRLAYSEDTGEVYRWQRVYPYGPLFADITGYDSWKYGRTGLESTYNNQLLGKASAQSFRSLGDMLLGSERRGDSVVLTVDSRLQKAASDALGNRKGAVVALDPSTGGILAMVTSPTFDPNATVPTKGRDTSAAWAALNADPNQPLFNRPTSGLYPPGSSFKTVVAAAALDLGVVTPASVYKCAGKLLVHGYPIYDFNKKTHGSLTFAQALVVSCNITFAQVGLQLGAQALVDYAERFGFNSAIPFDLPTEASKILNATAMASDPVQLATASFGQGQDLATPLQMAMVAATVANKGKMMKPHLVSEVQDYNAKIVEQFNPKQLSAVIKEDTAQTLTDMMVKVVEDGTGTAAQIDGVSVAGKTGTAEVAGAEPHAWFICFAPSDQPSLAIAVIVENGGEGGVTAAPIARKVMQKAREIGLL